MARRTMHIGGSENRFSLPPREPSNTDAPTPRERFRAILAELREASAAVADSVFWTPGSTARTEMTDAVARTAHAAGYRGEKPKKKDPPLTVEALRVLVEEKRGVPTDDPALNAAIERVKADISAKWEPVEKAAKARVDALKDQLDALADEVEVRPGPEPLVVRRHSANYSQGPGGNERYAINRCRIDVAGWEPKGVKCDVEKDGHGYAARAWVAGELDVEVLRRLHVPLREFVRLAWKLGGNPRVYFPGFPHGYEEREGLDFFGNDLRAQGSAGQSQADVDAEERRVLRACELVFDVQKMQRVRPGVWRGELRAGRMVEALPLTGLVAFEWHDAEGRTRTRSVYDVGKPVAGPLRIDGQLADDEG